MAVCKFRCDGKRNEQWDKSQGYIPLPPLMTHWENSGFRGSKTRHDFLNGEIHETQTAQITSLGGVRQAVEPPIANRHPALVFSKLSCCTALEIHLFWTSIMIGHSSCPQCLSYMQVYLWYGAHFCPLTSEPNLRRAA